MFRTYREFIGYSPFAMHDNISMLTKVTGLSQEEILANGVLNCAERRELVGMIRKLNKNYPIAYLLQSAYFYELSFYVNENVLIPRACTGTLIDAVMEEYGPNESFKVLDIGTGSGCIAITLAYKFPKAHVIGLDVCEKALSVAEINQKKFQVKNVVLKRSDLMENIHCKVDVLISNPPYVGNDDEVGEEVKYEPSIALYADDSGEKILRNIIHQSVGQVGKCIILEHAPWHGEMVSQCMKIAGYHSIKSIQDDSGKIRATKGYAKIHE